MFFFLKIPVQSVIGSGIQVSLSKGGRLISLDDLDEQSVDELEEPTYENVEPPPVALKIKQKSKPGYNPRCRRSLCSSH